MDNQTFFTIVLTCAFGVGLAIAIYAIQKVDPKLARTWVWIMWLAAMCLFIWYGGTNDMERGIRYTLAASLAAVATVLACFTVDYIKENGKSAADVKPVVLHPDVVLGLVSPRLPSVVLHNTSKVVAKDIVWSVILWNMDDPRSYLPGIKSPDTHEPLPIPTQIYNFLKPATQGNHTDLFNNQAILPLVKRGQRLVGTASVGCPDCEPGHSYLVSIVFGEGGWFSEITDTQKGEIKVPVALTRPAVQAYFEMISHVNEKFRIPIAETFSPRGPPNKDASGE